MVLRIEQVLVSRIGPKPDVIVAVVFVRDVDRNALGVLARVEDLEPVRVVNTGLRWAGAAAGRRRRRRRMGDSPTLRASAQEGCKRDGRQRRKAGTQPNRDIANGPGPETITCAFTSTAR